jgi:hypothetical protein
MSREPQTVICKTREKYENKTRFQLIGGGGGETIAPANDYIYSVRGFHHPLSRQNTWTEGGSWSRVQNSAQCIRMTRQRR